MIDTIPHGTRLGYRQRNCRCTPCVAFNTDTCREASQKRNSVRRGYLAMIKMAFGCSDCEYRAHPDALDFDHVRGPKFFHIGQSMSRPWEQLVAELEKCEVVCANCHRIRTSERRKKGVKLSTQ